MLELYKNIKTKRNELKISQEELAKMVGYTDRSMIAKVEKGEVDLSQSKIAAFAKALQTTPANLMGWDEEARVANILTQVTFNKDLQALIEQTKGLSDKSTRRLFKYIELLKEEEKEND